MSYALINQIGMLLLIFAVITAAAFIASKLVLRGIHHWWQRTTSTMDDAVAAIQVGDFVRLESGAEAYVVDIGWRTTRLRLLPNTLLVIPNSKLARSMVTNYAPPEKRMAVLIPINVSYGSDPERVEQILVEEATKAAKEVPGLLSEPVPFVRFIPGFGDFPWILP